jgi:hypothetical protein
MNKRGSLLKRLVEGVFVGFGIGLGLVVSVVIIHLIQTAV